jgi:hypothetical protein
MRIKFVTGLASSALCAALCASVAESQGDAPAALLVGFEPSGTSTAYA